MENDHLKRNNNKTKNQKAVSFFKLQYGLSTKKDILIIIIACIGSLGLGLSMPLFAILFGDTLNQFSPSNDPDFKQNFLKKMTKLSLLFVYVGIAMVAAAFLMMSLWNYNGLVITKRIKTNYFRLLMLQEQGYFDEQNPYEFSTKIQFETKTIEKGLGPKIGNTITSSTMFIASFVIGFVTSWKLSLVLCSAIPLLFLTGYFYTKFIQEESAKSKKSYEKAGGIAEEVLYNIKTVQSFANYEYEIERFDVKIKESMEFGIRNGMKSGLMMGLMFFLIYASYALAFWYGSTLIYNYEINPNTNQTFKAGDVLIVIFTIVFGAFSLGEGAPNVKAISEACAAASDFFELMNRIPKIDLTQSKLRPERDQITGHVEFRNVNFVYPQKPSKIILENFCLNIQPGRKLAIVGESGSGKSTIVNLIERLYDAEIGDITMDNINIKDFDLSYLRSLIGYVSQEPILFNTSIRENIIFGRENISDEEILEACKKAYADEFINKIKNGLDYVVGIRGSKLSGGQKQRIAIARAILTRPKILILDEATSALDNKSEKIVQKALNQVSQGVTTIIIAHRLSTIKDADQIVVLNEGRIVEIGNHNSLLELNRYYASLIKNQLELVNIQDNENEIVRDNNIDTEIHNNINNFQELDLEGINKFEEDSAKDVPNIVLEKKLMKKQFEEESNKFKKELWPILLKNKKKLILSSFFAACNGAVWPVYGVLLADSISSLSSPNYQVVKDGGFFNAMYFLILAFASGIFKFLQNYYFSSVGENLSMHLRHQVFEKYLRLHMGFYDLPENTPGSLLTRLSTDTTRINGITLTLVGVIVQVSVCLLIGIIISLIYDWRIALIDLAFLPILVLTSGLQWTYTRGFSEIDEEIDILAGSILSESVCNSKSIFCYNMQNKVVMMYKNILNSRNTEIYKTIVLTAFLFSLSQLVMFSSYAAVFYAGSTFLVNETISLNNMLRAIFPILLSAFGAGEAQQYIGDISKAKDSLVSIFRILKFPALIDPLDKSMKHEKHKIIGKVEFRNVSFSYPTRPGYDVLKNVSFIIYPSQSVAFVGPSGCGKSTIVQLIDRFYDSKSGEILIDDRNIKDYDIIDLRKQISLVQQEPNLFNRSVTENIRYGKLDSQMIEIQEAAKKAKISHLLNRDINEIENLNNFMSDRIVTDQYIPVSGGEKQRIAIARAIIRNPKILLLDEATSALDKNSEEIVIESLKESMKNKTTLMVAHRLSTVHDCDVIFVMDQGSIIEVGNHEKLYETKGVYYELYNAGSKIKL